ncbi:hypothetical protein skT53_30350 [Effusibacillus dendaii]|uniref:SelT/SelW/SelH family protein n=1 Tax=Effusibacillus dendaii TaxID=2743772 RepID=A0A7I8DHE8_9BACL|nr:hypothetical protein skT53_30350 [Effusibacillus dendaii]
MPKTVSVTEELLSNYTNKISELRLIPSSGGVFEIKIGDKLIFSKKESNRFPEPGEILNLSAGLI